MNIVYAGNIDTYYEEFYHNPPLEEKPLERMGFRHIADGNDSRVYLVDGHIFKEYERTLLPVTLLAYKHVVNQSMVLASDNQDRYAGTLDSLSGKPQFTFQINPINFMGIGYYTYADKKVDNNPFLMSISNYVPGPRLDRYIWYRNINDAGIKLGGEELSDVEEQEIKVLNHLFQASIAETNVKKELETIPAQLRALLEADTGYTGLDIMDTNIKVRYDSHTSRYVFIATDLCGNIEQLRKSKTNKLNT